MSKHLVRILSEVVVQSFLLRVCAASLLILMQTKVILKLLHLHFKGQHAERNSLNGSWGHFRRNLTDSCLFFRLLIAVNFKFGHRWLFW